MPFFKTNKKLDRQSRVTQFRQYGTQFQALFAAFIVFLVSGMRISWSIFDTPAGKFFSNDKTHNLMLAWFLGAACGAVQSMMCVERVSKKLIFASSGFLILISGVLTISLPEHYLAVYCSSMFIGCSYGMTHVQALITGGHVAGKGNRGLLVSSERTFLWMGISLHLLYTHIWFSMKPETFGLHFNIEKLHGLLVTALGTIAFVVALVHTSDTSSTHIIAMRAPLSDQVSIDITPHHKDAGFSTTELELLREMPSQPSSCHEPNPSTSAASVHWEMCSNFLALLKVLLLRCFACLAITLPFIRAFLVVSWNSLECEMNCLLKLATFGFVGSFIGSVLADKYGRRKLCFISLFLASLLLVIVGGVFEHLENAKKISNDIDLKTIAFIMLIFEAIIAAGVTAPALIYTAEAFKEKCRVKGIACALLCEQALQISLLLISFHVSYTISTYFFSFGGLSLILGIFVFLFVPETKNLTLNESQRKFSKMP